MNVKTKCKVSSLADRGPDEFPQDLGGTYPLNEAEQVPLPCAVCTTPTPLLAFPLGLERNDIIIKGMKH